MSNSQEVQVRRSLRKLGQRGMTTAEYAVGTVGAVTAAGTLIWIFQQEWFRKLLMALIEAIIRVVTGVSF